MKRLLREPLIHFLLIGAAVFARPTTRPRREAGAESVEGDPALTPDEVTQLAMLFQSQWRRPPTATSSAALVENRVQPEVLYREALAMGLDKDDEIVKRRMAQKMQFLAEDVAAAASRRTESSSVGSTRTAPGSRCPAA